MFAKRRLDAKLATVRDMIPRAASGVNGHHQTDDFHARDDYNDGWMNSSKDPSYYNFYFF